MRSSGCSRQPGRNSSSTPEAIRPGAPGNDRFDGGTNRENESVQEPGLGGLDGGGARQRIAQGYELLRAGRTAEAARLVDELLAAQGDDPDILLLSCEVRLAEDEAEAALALIDRAIEGARESTELLGRKAYVLMALMRRSDARELAARLAASAGDDARKVWAAARIYSRCDDPRPAAELFDKARKLGAAGPGLLYELASARFFLGQFEDAERDLEELLVLEPSNGQALYLRSTLRRQRAERNHVPDLQARLKAGFRGPADAAGCMYALAKELEDLEQWAPSFNALRQGAALKRRTLGYDAASERAAIDGIARAYTAEVVHADVPDRSRESPIFIVGLPRTGTTLVERILSRHSGAVSAGELPYFGGTLATAVGRRMRATGEQDPVVASLGVDFAALGRAYIDGARQAVGNAPGRVVDKMPVNFMYCGLIRKALPGARIIHLVRHPMDACYAIYKALFQQAYYFSYDLDELADYYATYHRLMQHWRTVMPGEVLDIAYEDLVGDTEQAARRVLDWCGLDWDPSVLDTTDDMRPATTASAAQVRQPVYRSSVGKWRHLRDQLAPLQSRLSAAGIAPD